MDSRLFYETSDSEEIKRAIDLLALDSVVELRVLHAEKGGTVSGYFDSDHRREMVEAAEFWSGKAPGVYIMLNPVLPVLMARACNRAKIYAKDTTKDSEIIRRLWLPIDFDPKRPSGISASDDEHALALSSALYVREYLSGRGWPEPIFGDSGNGAHLLYRIDLPNDSDSLGLVRQCLESISNQFSNEQVKVDGSVGNAARIWRLYGTLNAKGDPTPDRPHRISRIRGTPDHIEIVSADQLRALLPTTETSGKLKLPNLTSNPHPKDDLDLLNSGGFDLRVWLDAHKMPVVREKEWKDCAILYTITSTAEEIPGINAIRC